MRENCENGALARFAKVGRDLKTPAANCSDEKNETGHRSKFRFPAHVSGPDEISNSAQKTKIARKDRMSSFATAKSGPVADPGRGGRGLDRAASEGPHRVRAGEPQLRFQTRWWAKTRSREPSILCPFP